MAKYEPYLIGTGHIAKNTTAVIEIIKQSGIRVAGIEPSKWVLSRPTTLTGREIESRMFWKRIMRELDRNGISIVHLTPDKIAQTIQKEAKLLASLLGRDYSGELKRSVFKSHFAKLVKLDMTHEMIQTARIQHPDALIVGGGHVPLMQHDLGVPDEKMRLVDVREQEMRKYRDELKELLEYRNLQMRKKSKKEKKKKKKMRNRQRRRR